MLVESVCAVDAAIPEAATALPYLDIRSFIT